MMLLQRNLAPGRDVGARLDEGRRPGPGDPWVSLNAAKTAHKQGLTSSIACNKPGEAQKMLWGADLTTEMRPRSRSSKVPRASAEILEDAEGLIYPAPASLD